MAHTLIGVAAAVKSGRYIGSDDNAGENKEGMRDGLSFDSFEDELLETLDESRAIKTEAVMLLAMEASDNVDAVDVVDVTDDESYAEQLDFDLRYEAREQAALRYEADLIRRAKRGEKEPRLEDDRAIMRAVPESIGCLRQAKVECSRSNQVFRRNRNHHRGDYQKRHLPNRDRRHAYGRKPWQHDEHLARVETAHELWWDELEHISLEAPLPDGVSDMEATWEEAYYQELCREALVTAEYLSNLDRRAQEANYFVCWWSGFYRDRGIMIYADAEKRRLDAQEEVQRLDMLRWYVAKQDAKATALATKLNYGNPPTTIHLMHAHMVLALPRYQQDQETTDLDAAVMNEHEEHRHLELQMQRMTEDRLERLRRIDMIVVATAERLERNTRRSPPRISKISPSVPRQALNDFLDEAI